MSDNRKEKERRLDQVALRWKTTPPEGNEAVIESLRQQVFTLSFELFDSDYHAMAFMDAFEEAYQKYDAAKGDFTKYLSKLLKGRKTDHFRYDSRHAPSGDSLDEPVPSTEDNGRTKGDEIPSPKSDLESGVMFDASVLDLMTLMLNLETRLDGKKNNPTRINYYRLFFTDEVADIIRFSNSVEIKAFTRRERDLFKVLKVSFLNFCMRNSCNCVEDIWYNDWKLLGQIVKGKPMEPPKKMVENKNRNGKKRKMLERFLPLDVYTTYLKQVENHPIGTSAIDPHRKDYEKFMQEQLQC